MAKTAKKAHVREEFLFLNQLRESGVTNMFGAAPYIAEEFDISKPEARKVLSAWMDWVNENTDNVNL